MAKFDVTSIGESLLRYSTPSGFPLETARKLDLTPGGAEHNVVSIMSRLGRRCGYITSLPETALGRIISKSLNEAGVNLDAVLWKKVGRIGTYYIEYGVPPRAIQAIYDRADSCAAQLSITEIKQDYLLDTHILHLTGITPALSASCRDAMTQIIFDAHNAHVPISFDINYRRKLWNSDVAAQTLLPLIKNIALLLCKEADARQLFGCTGTPHEIIHQLAKLTNAKQIVVTSGEKGATGFDGQNLFSQPAIPTVILDRIGSGDAFAAGVLHGWLDGDLHKGVHIGVILAALKLTQYGDTLVLSPDLLSSMLDNQNNSTDPIR